MLNSMVYNYLNLLLAHLQWNHEQLSEFSLVNNIAVDLLRNGIKDEVFNVSSFKSNFEIKKAYFFLFDCGVGSRLYFW